MSSDSYETNNTTHYTVTTKQSPFQHKRVRFPIILYHILSKPENESIITWLPDGRSWMILNHKALEDKIIPLYFRHKNLSSFIRQVNGWGFRRKMKSLYPNTYYHRNFLRASPNLCETMRRLKSKAKTTADYSSPDFAKYVNTQEAARSIPIKKESPSIVMHRRYSPERMSLGSLIQANSKYANTELFVLDRNIHQAEMQIIQLQNRLLLRANLQQVNPCFYTQCHRSNAFSLF